MKNEEEFDAYFFTLIDSGATGELEFDQGRLIARGRNGAIFRLSPLQVFDDAFVDVPAAWEYLSTFMGDMNGTGIGGDVLWGDGSVEPMRYPGPFPMTKLVAQLGRRFVVQSEID